jgi:hypothetical protein
MKTGVVLALLKTLFDIIRLRRGPDALPYSPLLFVIIGLMWLIAGLVMTLATAELDKQDFIIGSLTGMVGIACYAAIVVLVGKGARLLQTVMALLGCGALLSLMYVAGDLVLTPLLGDDLSIMIVTLILLWTVPVEGHIISRAIERHWYLGVAIAMGIFIFQLKLYSILNPSAVAAT